MVGRGNLALQIHKRLNYGQCLPALLTAFTCSRGVEMSNVHEASLARAYDSLEGLSVGDAFGETFFIHSPLLPRLIEQRIVPEDPPWDWTDDTNMALSIISVLRQHQQIDQDALAISFAKRYDFLRSYGMGMHRLLGLL